MFNSSFHAVVVLDLGKNLSFKSIKYMKLSIIMIILAEFFSKSLNGSVKQVEVGRIFSFYVREIVLFFRDRVTTLFFQSFHTLAFLSCPFVPNSFEPVFFSTCSNSYGIISIISAYNEDYTV